MRNSLDEPLLEGGTQPGRQGGSNVYKMIVGILLIALLVSTAFFGIMWATSGAEPAGHDDDSKEPSRPPRTHGMTTATAKPDMTTGTTLTTTAGPTTTTMTTTEGPPPPDPASFKQWKEMAAFMDSAMDRTVDPCTDFYSYACGSWLSDPELNQKPEDKTRWARSFSVLADMNQKTELEILTSSGWPLVGRLYDSCFNNGLRNKVKTTVLNPMLKVVNDMTLESLPQTIATLHLKGVSVLFDFGPSPDPISDNPKTKLNLPTLIQGGTRFSTTTYTDDSVIAAYKALVLGLAKLLPTNSNGVAYNASVIADATLNFEQQLVNISLSPAEMRDPYKMYNKLSVEKVSKLTLDKFDWIAYFDTLKVDISGVDVNVMTMDFFKGLGVLIKSVEDNQGEMDVLRNYLRGKVAQHGASYLGKEQKALLADFAKVYSGQVKETPDEQKCASQIQQSPIGYLVGHIYVLKNFSESTRGRANSLIHSVIDAFGDNLPHWLSDSGKQLVREKIAAINIDVGFPDIWLALEGIDDLGTLTKANYFANMQKIQEWTIKKALSTVNKVHDTRNFDMVPQLVNAYYSPEDNKMVFPAGILAWTFFNPDAPSSVNLGAIGAVMGHELSHGFDDQGREYGPHGALHWGDKWSQEDYDQFKTRTECVVDLYDGFEVPELGEGFHVNGKLTLGENVADLGGVKTAYRAFSARYHSDPAFRAREDAAAMLFENWEPTPQELFMVSFAQNWCTLSSDAQLKSQIRSDPHSPGRFRTLGPLMSMAEFAKTYRCAKGAFMAPEKRCSVW